MTYTNTGYQHSTIDQSSGIVLNTVENVDAFGNIKQYKAGNDVTTNNTYDNLGRVTSIGTTGYNTNIQSLTYIYDDVGNLKSRFDSRGLEGFSEQFTYDNVNRLKTVKARTGNMPLITTMSFAYDAGGRMTDNNGQAYSYTGGPVHGVNTVGNKNYVYDANGNQEVSDGRTMEYSPFNKVEHMHQGGTSVSFEYDHNNERFKRVDVGAEENETTYYVGNVEFMVKANGTTLAKRYIGDAVITRYSESINKVTYLHRDHLGSVQTVTSQNYSDLTTEHLSYDAYGRRRDAGNNSSIITQNPISEVTKRGYTGQEHVDQLGVINYNARLYDPELGMMLQADTIIPDGPVTQSLNRYSYVFNNPLSYTDPTGHSPIGWPNPFSAHMQDSLEIVGDLGDEQSNFANRVFENQQSQLIFPDGINLSTVSNQQSNGLGGNEQFNGGGLDDIGNRYNSAPDPKKSRRSGFYTGSGVIQGKFGSHDMSGTTEEQRDAAGREFVGLFDPSQALRGCYSETCGVGGWVLAAAEVIPVAKWGKRAGKFLSEIPELFFKKGGGSNTSDFITRHSEKHMFDSTIPSRPNRSQFGEDIDVAALRKDTMNNPDSASSNIITRVTKYSKEYNFNISTPDTPSGSSRVFINNNIPSSSSQFPYIPRD